MILDSLIKVGKDLYDDSRETQGIVSLLEEEIKANSRLIDMAVNDGLSLDEVVRNLGTNQYEELKIKRFNFNKLHKAKIETSDKGKYSTLKAWNGKTTAEFIENVYDKINDIKSMYPKIKNTSKRRWGVRIKNLNIKLQFLRKHLT